MPHRSTVRHFVEYWYSAELKTVDRSGAVAIGDIAVLVMEREDTIVLM